MAIQKPAKNQLQPKDPVTKEQRTDAIYSIPCNDCDSEYIGQTKHQFGTQLKERQKAVFLCKKENSAKSANQCSIKLCLISFPISSRIKFNSIWNVLELFQIFLIPSTDKQSLRHNPEVYLL